MWNTCTVSVEMFYMIMSPHIYLHENSLKKNTNKVYMYYEVYICNIIETTKFCSAKQFTSMFSVYMYLLWHNLNCSEFSFLSKKHFTGEKLS